MAEEKLKTIANFYLPKSLSERLQDPSSPRNGYVLSLRSGAECYAFTSLAGTKYNGAAMNNLGPHLNKRSRKEKYKDWEAMTKDERLLAKVFNRKTQFVNIEVTPYQRSEGEGITREKLDQISLMITLNNMKLRPKRNFMYVTPSKIHLYTQTNPAYLGKPPTRDISDNLHQIVEESFPKEVKRTLRKEKKEIEKMLENEKEGELKGLTDRILGVAKKQDIPIDSSFFYLLELED